VRARARVINLGGNIKLLVTSTFAIKLKQKKNLTFKKFLKIFFFWIHTTLFRTFRIYLSCKLYNTLWSYLAYC